MSLNRAQTVQAVRYATRRLWQAYGAGWIFLLGVTIMVGLMSPRHDPGQPNFLVLVIPLAYLGAGVVISRAISQNVRNLHHLSLDAIVRAKVRVIYTWPWSMPGLLMRIHLNNNL